MLEAGDKSIDDWLIADTRANVNSNTFNPYALIETDYRQGKGWFGSFVSTDERRAFKIAYFTDDRAEFPIEIQGIFINRDMQSENEIKNDMWLADWQIVWAPTLSLTTSILFFVRMNGYRLN